MPIDPEDGGFIGVSGDTGMDTHGHVHTRAGDISIDTSTGFTHPAGDWDDGDECGGRRRRKRRRSLLGSLFRGDE